MLDLKRGNIVQMTSMNIRPNEEMQFSFRAPRGKQFVCLFLGVEDKKDAGQKLDTLAVMDAMGWKPKNAERLQIVERAARGGREDQLVESRL
jgi:hypothetical protein